MTKTIWYVSKYCNIKYNSSFGSRGWFLMREFSLKGYQSVIITSNYSNSINFSENSRKFVQLLNDGVKVFVLKIIDYENPKSIFRIFSWLSFEFHLFFFDKKSLPKPDVLIVSSLSLLTIINGLYLKKKYRCKLIFEIRDIWPLTLVEEGYFSIYNPFIMLLGFIEYLGYKKSDLIVGTMPNLGQHVEHILGYHKSVKCIPMGVSHEILNSKKNLTPEYFRRHLTPGFFNVFYVGTIGATNALDVFFNAAEILKNDSIIRFVIVGDGALRKTYIENYGHLPNVIYFPEIDKKQVQSFLAYADILYFSTHKSKVWNYGQSLNKIIDYMVAQKPIVASYSGYYSMINEANCGYFVPANDPRALISKIKEIMMMTEVERNTMGAKGLSWLLEHRRYDKLADDYLKLLFECKN